MALTAGQVTPNDFLPALPPEPLATPAPSEAAG
jgi:hypothetical protein